MRIGDFTRAQRISHACASASCSLRREEMSSAHELGCVLDFDIEKKR